MYLLPREEANVTGGKYDISVIIVLELYTSFKEYCLYHQTWLSLFKFVSHYKHNMTMVHIPMKNSMQTCPMFTLLQRLSPLIILWYIDVISYRIFSIHLMEYLNLSLLICKICKVSHTFKEHVSCFDSMGDNSAISWHRSDS